MPTEGLPSRHRSRCHRRHCPHRISHAAFVETFDDNSRQTRVCSLRERENDGQVGYCKFHHDRLSDFLLTFLFHHRVRIQSTSKPHRHSRTQHTLANKLIENRSQNCLKTLFFINSQAHSVRTKRNFFVRSKCLINFLSR
jgi:hypothetical protein